MPQSDADTELMARVASGDRAAMRSLFAQHNVRVFRFLIRRLRNEALAEEVTNEVFLDVWRQAGRYEGRSSVSTWMLAIAHNKAVSLLRKRSEVTLDEEIAERLPDSGDDPEQHAQKQSKAAVMRQMLELLSDEHREVIDLVYYHEKSVREVAEITGVPEATVKTRMHYARKLLGEKLKSAGIDRGWP